MSKKIIIGIIIVGLLAGGVYGSSVDPNTYPIVIQPQPPFSIDDSLTNSGKQVTSETLPSIMAAPDTKAYLMLKLSVTCSDINVYALDENQSTDTAEPIQVIEGQDVDCDNSGSSIDTDLIVDASKQIVLESDEPFSYASYLGVEGDDHTFKYNPIGGEDNE